MPRLLNICLGQRFWLNIKEASQDFLTSRFEAVMSVIRKGLDTNKPVFAQYINAATPRDISFGDLFLSRSGKIPDIAILHQRRCGDELNF